MPLKVQQSGRGSSANRKNKGAFLALAMVMSLQTDLHASGADASAPTPTRAPSTGSHSSHAKDLEETPEAGSTLATSPAPSVEAAFAAGDERPALLIYFAGIDEPTLSNLTQDLYGGAPISSDSPHDYESVTASAPGLFEPLRAALVPGTSQTERPNGEACEATDSLSEYLASASKHIDFFELQKAAQSLKDGHLAFACSTTRISTEELARLLFLEATLEIESGREAESSMADVLAISPDFAFPELYSEAVKSAYAAVEAAPRDSISLKMHSEIIEPNELWVDGRPIHSSPFELRAGHHFVQLVEPEGRVVAGIELRLDGSDTQTRDWPPKSLIPPDETQVLRRLEEAVSTQSLPPDMERALKSFAASEDRTEVRLAALAHSKTSENSAHKGSLDAESVNLLSMSSGEVRWTSLPLAESARAQWRSALLGASFGLCAAAAGGVSAYTYRQIQTVTYPTYNDAARALRTNHIAGTTALSCLTGTAITSAIHYVFLRTRKKKLASKKMPPIWPILAKNTLTDGLLLQLEGNW